MLFERLWGNEGKNLSMIMFGHVLLEHKDIIS